MTDSTDIPLNLLGFDAWFREKTETDKNETFSPARVLTVNKDNFLIRDAQKTVRAELSGRLMFSADTPLDLPAVGDWVRVQYFDGKTFAIIHDILPRKTVLKRKTAGKKVDFQLIAANIDTALLMQSLDANFNPRRLERYLVMTAEGGIDPVILLSKRDLLTDPELDEKVSGLKQQLPDIPVIPFSNTLASDFRKVEQLLIPEKTYCLLGSSGVGKTTLLNNLAGGDYRTRSVRDQDSKGRHTTSGRHLTILENGAMIIDTPGMRELGNFDIEAGLLETFDEIAALAPRCKFKDCTHTSETECAVVSALQAGEISEARYQNYIKMWKESRYQKMSYLEKRQRDKSFGKMVKNLKKTIPKYKK